LSAGGRHMRTPTCVIAGDQVGSSYLKARVLKLELLIYYNFWSAGGDRTWTARTSYHVEYAYEPDDK
jgi:hypothetical protein